MNVFLPEAEKKLNEGTEHINPCKLQFAVYVDFGDFKALIIKAAANY